MKNASNMNTLFVRNEKHHVLAEFRRNANYPQSFKTCVGELQRLTKFGRLHQTAEEFFDCIEVLVGRINTIEGKVVQSRKSVCRPFWRMRFFRFHIYFLPELPTLCCSNRRWASLRATFFRGTPKLRPNPLG